MDTAREGSTTPWLDDGACLLADAPFWQHPGHLVFLPAVPARFTAAQGNEVQVNGAQPAHALHPRSFHVAPRNAPSAQPGARVRKPSAVQLLETPVIYRGRSL